MSETCSIDTDGAVESLGQGRYRATLHERWWGYTAAHGGYLACVLMRAMAAELNDSSRTPRSITTHFLRGPQPGSVDVSVELVRSGGKLSTLTARMQQANKPICMAVAAYGAAYGDAQWSDVSMPAAPQPSQVQPQKPSSKVAIDHRFELRPCLGDAPFSGAQHARFGGWGRLAEPRAVDEYSLTLLADGFWPSLFTRLTDKRQAGGAPTVDLTVHFRTSLPHRPERDDDYVLVDLQTRTIADGYLDESARLWGADGTLLAESTQLAVRLLPKR